MRKKTSIFLAVLVVILGIFTVSEAQSNNNLNHQLLLNKSQIEKQNQNLNEVKTDFKEYKSENKDYISYAKVPVEQVKSYQSKLSKLLSFSASGDILSKETDIKALRKSFDSFDAAQKKLAGESDIKNLEKDLKSAKDKSVADKAAVDKAAADKAAADKAAADKAAADKAAADKAAADKAASVATATGGAEDSNPNNQGQIIGNVNSKIYHVPGQATYRIKPDHAVYFNSEEEAQAAGYRKSKK